MSSCSSQTSGCSQLRSGCSGANRCRYHSPSATRVQAEPPKIDCQPFGGSSPSAPLPGRNQKRRRAGGSGGRGERLLEPRVLVGDVVRDDVDDRADPERAGLGDQLLGFPERPESGIDRAVVGDVVAGVGERRRVPRVEPERVDAERGQIRETRAHARQIADAVAVRVGEAPDVDLVDDRVAPPGALGRTLRRRPLRSRIRRFRLPHHSCQEWHSRQTNARHKHASAVLVLNNARQIAWSD